VSFVLGNNLPTHNFSLENARKWGFKVPKEAILAHSLEDVFSILTTGTCTDTICHMKRMELLKVNHFQYQDELGYPKITLGNGIQVQVRTVSTKLNSITYQVGRTVQLRRLRT
jgi:DNA ligase (NAD+)